MKRPVKQSDGMYHVEGSKYKVLIGSRQQVFNGTAFKTSGGLKKKDILMNRWGRLVSASKHASAKQENRLKKHGYTAQKGKFGAVKISPSSSKSSKGSRSSKGSKKSKGSKGSKKSKGSRGSKK